MADGSPRRRLRACVEAWPECAEGLFDPNCCRFPKSCSCDVYDPEQVTDADLEEPQHPSQSDRRSGGAPHSSQVERALSLLVNASRVSPPLREALFTDAGWLAEWCTAMVSGCVSEPRRRDRPATWADG